MRYVIAMICAVIVALMSTLLIAGPVADWYVSRRTFIDSDTVADVHALVFMVFNLSALAIGWGLGWLIASKVVKPDAPI